MNGDAFAQQIDAMRWRLQELYQDACQLPPQLELLPRAFMELGTASEELQIALEELRQQNQELIATRAQVETQRQRYQELFNFAPDAYLVTDPYGKILEVNRAAATLLHVAEEFLAGRLLIDFIALERRIFRDQLNQVCHKNSVHEWEIAMIPHRGNPIKVQATIVAVRDALGKAVTLRWLLHEVTNHEHLQEVGPEGDEDNYTQSRPRQAYSKGEVISLQPETVWVVCQGLVKLSTLAENGVEVLVGLVGAGMIFGSGLTNLQVYQAIAFSKDVELVFIPLTEIEASPRLAQTLLPKINQRLRQAESLLAISGQRRVSERLYRLLLLLKQEIGQPVARGTRLGVRLTHEDLAHTCGTTRVTITRMLSKLQHKGKITFDAQHHIILLESTFSTEKPEIRS